MSLCLKTIIMAVVTVSLATGTAFAASQVQVFAVPKSQARPGDVVQVVAVPAGAVMAFATKCPKGWKPFAAAIGRTVVGAGSLPAGTTNNDEDGHPLPQLQLQATGGLAASQLGLANLPQIPFQVPYRWSKTSASKGGFPLMRILGTSGADDGTVYSGATGGSSAPFTNYSPYIALNYCEKK